MKANNPGTDEVLHAEEPLDHLTAGDLEACLRKYPVVVPTAYQSARELGIKVAASSLRLVAPFLR